MSEWISVKEKPIPTGRVVAICHIGGNVAFCVRRDLRRRHGNTYEYMVNGVAARIPEVTHWMPLPEPPRN